MSRSTEGPRGTTLALPRPPWRAVGRPCTQTRGGRSEPFRNSYDWKAYKPRQLGIMRGYWRDYVRAVESLLPARYREDRSRVRGINLGTYNGCYQREWMELGYSMYGLELAEVIDELHEYGCEGHRGSFYDMPELGSESFDFAIMDRCLCAEYSVGSEGTRPNREASPFSEPVRVLKPNGVLVTIIYHHWAGDTVRDLAAHGDLTFGPCNNPRPFLWARLVKGSKPTMVPRLEQAAAELAPSSSTPEELWQAVTASPLFLSNSRSRTPSGTIRGLYLPDNELVELAPTGVTRIVSSSYWATTPWATEFFHGSELKAVAVGRRGRRKATILTDMPGFYRQNRPRRSPSVAAAGRLARELDVIRLDQLLKGSRGALSLASTLADRIAEGIAFVSLSHRDSGANPRTGEPRQRLERHLENLRHLVEALSERGVEVRFFAGLPSAAEDPSGVQGSYEEAARQLAGEMNLPWIDVDYSSGSHRARDGARISRRGAVSLAEQLASSL